MCAINGTTQEARELVLRMNAKTHHRGPDGTQVWVGDGVTFGHNRLAIIDVAERSLQPMHDATGRYHIVFNGEIYNYRELKDELKAQYAFKTEGDTEVLLAAYIVWGDQMFPKLRGMFAFGIWDSEQSELLLARDHMGIKPLYYSVRDGILTFSSELPALIDAGSLRTFNLHALSFYLTMEYVPGPETLVTDVHKLRPGQALRFKKGNTTLWSFLGQIPSKRSVSHEALYTTIEQAVTRELVSDRPVGAYLSGGFDSSIVVHHMTKHTPHARTYSVAFEAVSGQESDSEKFNADADLAARTAAFYGTDHKTCMITLGDVRSTLEHACARANEPVANATAITQFLLSDFVRKDGTIVVLGGDGGDELFGGYTRHRAAMSAYLYQKMPHIFQKGIGKLVPRFGKLSTPFGAPLHRALMVKDEKKLQPFMQTQFKSNAEVQEYFERYYNEVGMVGRHPLDVFMHVDRETWLPDECFIRSDYASMAHGIELRVPFVDLDLVALSDAISPWKKTLPHEGKRIIRSTYRKHLPEHLYGQPKRGWLSPAAKWFRDDEIGAFAREVYSSSYYSGLDGLFDWNAVHTFLDAHIEKRGYYLYPLWNILVLQIWARAHSITLE